MKKLFLTVTIILFAVVVFEFVTVLVLGNKELINQVTSANDSYIGSRPNKLLVIYGNCSDAPEPNLDNTSQISSFYNVSQKNIKPLSVESKRVWNDLLMEKFDSVYFIENARDISIYHGDRNYVEYSVCFFNKYNLLSIVPEEVALYDTSSGDALIKNRTTIYFWFFLKWIKIKTVDQGST